MTAIDPNSTLSSIATAHPGLVRELERRGLDYCCHGDRSIADACDAADLDPSTVVEDLRAAVLLSTDESWADLDPAALVDHIEAVHHRYLWDELPRLQVLVDKVVAVHGARHPELEEVAECLSAVRADLEPHLTKEERVLFPMIRELSTATSRSRFRCGRVTTPISMMTLEHERSGQLLAQLRTATNAYHTPDDACASYRVLYDGLAQLESDTHVHIHKENNLLFPAVAQIDQQLPEIADMHPTP